MIIRGVPSNLEDYEMFDGETAFLLQQAGVHPAYMDGGCYYFKLSKKLYKALDKIGIVL